MTYLDEIGEQHIVEYQARLKHFEEQLEEAEKGAAGGEQTSEVENELAELRQERQKLLDDVEEIKKKPMKSGRKTLLKRRAL